MPAVRSLTRLTEPGDEFTVSATLEVGLPKGAVKVELDLSGAIDVAAERKRLAKDLAAAQKELDGTTKKLGNEAFLAKAPADVKAKIEERKAVAEAEIARINERLAALPEA